nr:adenylyl cyclase 78C-like [Helicoverpa armigera]
MQESERQASTTMPSPRYFRGIYCPTIADSFLDKADEQSYQKVSRRQRQKSLILVNLIDLALKVGLIIIYTVGIVDALELSLQQILWTTIFMICNVCLCSLCFWPHFASNYLHWAAGATWILFIVQGMYT